MVERRREGTVALCCAIGGPVIADELQPRPVRSGGKHDCMEMYISKCWLVCVCVWVVKSVLNSMLVNSCK